MKKAGIVLGVIAAALVLTMITSSVFAAFQPKRGIELAADVLGVTVDELIEQRDETGKTIHEIVVEAGKLDELTQARLDQMKLILADRVANGDLTQAEADEWYAEMVERMEYNLANGITGYGRGGMMGGYGAGTGFGCGAQTRGGNYRQSNWNR